MKMIDYKLTNGLESKKPNTYFEYSDWYFECDRDSDHLLVTAGDSWTYGVSLDTEKRTEQVYGALLSSRKKSDWINVGLPGESNLVIKDFVHEVVNNLSKTYKSKTIIFTLTESTRDLVSLDYAEENYNFIKDESWPTFSNLDTDTINIIAKEFPGSHILDIIELYVAIQKSNSMESMIATVENVTVNSIRNCFPDTNIILARNFTHWSNLDNSDVQEIWTENIARNGNLSAYPVKILFGQLKIGGDKYGLLGNKFTSNFKLDLINHIDDTLSAIKWLEGSPYNSNRGSKHPLKQAHSWWAEHLYQYCG